VAGLSLEEYEKLNPRCELVHEGVPVVYATPNSATKWRVDTLFSKEPVTIEWIGGFSAGEVLIDVGANVGMYSVWAAKTRGARVFAFEPEAQNYALLNRNIALNGLEGRIVAYCAGLLDRSGFSVLNLSENVIGGSCHTVGERLDFNLRPMKPAFTQGCVAATLDELVSSGTIPCPAYIKLDVDGLEHKVIAGARATIADPAVKSLLVEINQNLAEHRRLVTELQAAGFSYDAAQVARAERKSGPFKGVAEHVFFR
jgi:FkbM family methyltransferase